MTNTSVFYCPSPLVSYSSQPTNNDWQVTTLDVYGDSCAIPCPTIVYNHSEWKLLTSLVKYLVLAACISSALVLIAHLHSRKYFIRKMFIVGFLGQSLILTIFMFSNQNDSLVCNGAAHFTQRKALCVIQASSTVCFMFWTEIWSAILAIDTYLHVNSFRHKFFFISVENRHFYYTVVAILSSAIVTFFPLFSYNLGFDPYANIPICLFLIHDNSSFFWWVFFAPFYVCLFVCFVVSLSTAFTIHKIFITSSHYKSQSQAQFDGDVQNNYSYHNIGNKNNSDRKSSSSSSISSNSSFSDALLPADEPESTPDKQFFYDYGYGPGSHIPGLLTPRMESIGSPTLQSLFGFHSTRTNSTSNNPTLHPALAAESLDTNNNNNNDININNNNNNNNNIDISNSNSNDGCELNRDSDYFDASRYSLNPNDPNLPSTWDWDFRNSSTSEDRNSIYHLTHGLLSTDVTTSGGTMGISSTIKRNNSFQRDVDKGEAIGLRKASPVKRSSPKKVHINTSPIQGGCYDENKSAAALRMSVGSPDPFYKRQLHIGIEGDDSATGDHNKISTTDEDDNDNDDDDYDDYDVDNGDEDEANACDLERRLLPPPQPSSASTSTLSSTVRSSSRSLGNRKRTQSGHLNAWRTAWHFHGRSIVFVVVFCISSLCMAPICLDLYYFRYNTFTTSANDFVECLLHASFTSPSQSQADVDRFALAACGSQPQNRPDLAEMSAVLGWSAAYGIIPSIIFGSSGSVKKFYISLYRKWFQKTTTSASAATICSASNVTTTI